ncbi:tetratricopeptide repeat protein [Glycomyces sp. L485]|uniref:J domain-containing protein n=1 Tax=Glycomyces sp. L485 TaxID=2909235 RepID=UPI001F4AC2D3|nr:tetratricopeptide repeat protein [Glycomyces sp. L485]MCH7231050.1 tetratricopeptide repeat protein [Glycomyces sp. L485]
MEDLYLAVGVSRTAPKEEIETAVKQKFRLWNKKVNSADLSRRQEAETMVERLAEARKVLLDNAKRAEYDRRLNAEGALRPEPRPTAAGGGDWLSRAMEYLGRNDYHSAAYAAREARKEIGETGEVWETLARASIGLNRLDNALYESQEAALLDQGNPERHFLVADVLESQGKWGDAVRVYEQVRVMPGAADEADMGIANAYISTGRYQDAIKILDRLYESTGGGVKEVAGRYLAIALLCRVEEVPKIQIAGGYIVTSTEEISAMRRLLARIPKVTDDAELRAAAREKEVYLKSCEEEKYWPEYPGFELFKAGGIGALVAILSFVCAGNGQPGFVVLGLLAIGIAIAYMSWVVNDRRKVQWEVNAIITRGKSSSALDLAGSGGTERGVY